MDKIEYLQRRLDLAENIIEELGYAIASQLPSLTPHLEYLGRKWKQGIADINTDRATGMKMEVQDED